MASLRAHYVDSLEDRVALLQRQVLQGKGSIRDPLMRRIGLLVTRHCPPRDDMCELRAIFDFVVRNTRYTGDIAGRDTFQTPLRTLQYGGGDCLPLSTLVLRDDYEFVPLGDLQAGQRIMADGAWTEVQEAWVTGEKPILAFDLNNGSTLRCSPDHRLFTADGQEIRAEDVKPGQGLLSPKEIPCADVFRSSLAGWQGMSVEEFAWLLGVYVADGWSEPYRFAISGRDGKPKEEQKRRVESLMVKAGAATRWHERYIAVNDKQMAQFFAACGKRAPEKHVPSLRLARAEVGPLLEGLRADAGIANSGTVVHGTTSPVLVLQLRVLYRMLGQSTHIRRVDNHGGLGSHPMYRVTVRAPEDTYEKKRSAVRSEVRVRGVREEEDEELCGDITTAAGKFWLPESDTIVHNCDDHAQLSAVLAMENGFTSAFRITSNTGRSWDHIFCLAGVPKHRPKEWVILDTTLGPGRFNRQPNYVKRKDFKIR